MFLSVVFVVCFGAFSGVESYSQNFYWCKNHYGKYQVWLLKAPFLADLVAAPLLSFISLKRDGAVGFGGSTLKEAAIEKCLSMGQHSGTIALQQFSARKVSDQ